MSDNMSVPNIFQPQMVKIFLKFRYNMAVDRVVWGKPLPEDFPALSAAASPTKAKATSYKAQEKDAEGADGKAVSENGAVGEAVAQKAAFETAVAEEVAVETAVSEKVGRVGDYSISKEWVIDGNVKHDVFRKWERM